MVHLSMGTIHRDYNRIANRYTACLPLPAQSQSRRFSFVLRPHVSTIIFFTRSATLGLLRSLRSPAHQFPSSCLVVWYFKFFSGLDQATVDNTRVSVVHHQSHSILQRKWERRKEEGWSSLPPYSGYGRTSRYTLR